MRIYIDANNVSLALQFGFSIAGIYAPARIIQGVFAFLGIASSQVKDGIWFDYNYYLSFLGFNCGLQ